MEDNIKTLWTLLLLAFCLAMTFFGLGYKMGRESMDAEWMKPVADTIRETDTVTIVEAQTDTVIRIVSRPYLVAIHDTIRETHIRTDSIWVTLPYEHHYYEQPDTLQLWYSGFDAKIDSAIVYAHQQTIIERHYERQPNNVIGITAGARDASVMYMRRFGNFYAGFSAGTTYEGQPTARGVVGLQF